MATEIAMPRLSDSMEEGTILAWLVAEGDTVTPGQALAEIETDKANVTFEAESAGVILSLMIATGETVRVGTSIAVIGAAGEPISGGAHTTPVPAGGGAATAVAAAPRAGRGGQPPAPTPQARRPKASPLARRIAAELGIDPSSLAGSGPQGRVIRSDVERAAATTRSNGGAGETTSPGAKGRTAVHELTRLQQTVARRMAESRASVPDIELRCEVDMGETVALRERLCEIADPVPTINDFIVKSAASVLREYPRVNGAYRDGRFETFARVNVGIAVAAPDALVVPTIFDADTRSLGELARTARGLADRARDGSITPAELAGGTFTVSNLGMYGVDSFSAVINPPQAAILAVGALKRRPVVDEVSGELVARPTLILTLACDHRILYGADGAQFLARVRDLLEHPHALLL